MKITTSIKLPKGGSATGKVTNVKKMNELQKIILHEKYSLGTFKENHILKPNFIQAYSFALDFDGGYSIKKAKEDFSKFRHIIATTKSHQKEKNGVVDDRFRVILFFSESINTNELFRSTVRYVMSLFPKADKACSNSNRWFYPSKEVISISIDGFEIDPIANFETYNEKGVDILMVKKGKLSEKSKKLLRKGLTPGNRNNDTYMIASDFQCNGYSEDEAIDYILQAYDKTESLSFDFTEDEVVNTIKSAYTSDPTADPRTPFKLQRYKDIKSTVEKKKWVLDKVLAEGGFSLVVGVPKVAKSHIARQLCRCILTKNDFLERKTKYGEVHYYALEEQISDVKEVFDIWKLPEDAPLYIHAGDHNSQNTLKDLKAILIERKPVLIVIDTLFDILDVIDENSYGQVKKSLRKLKQVARDTGTHILCVHHSNKSFNEVKGNFNRVLGSQAIIGGVDSAILMELDGNTRIITSQGRRIKPWYLRTLIWDEEWEYYTLGPKYEPEEF